MTAEGVDEGLKRYLHMEVEWHIVNILVIAYRSISLLSL